MDHIGVTRRDAVNGKWPSSIAPKKWPLDKNILMCKAGFLWVKKVTIF